jgi:hypothetical protein
MTVTEKLKSVLDKSLIDNMRFEVIEHTRTGTPGRKYVKYNVNLEFSVQDDGRTLKVFITD